MSEWLQLTTQETTGFSEDVEKGETSTLLAGMQTGAAIPEIHFSPYIQAITAFIFVSIT